MNIDDESGILLKLQHAPCGESMIDSDCMAILH